MRNVAIVDVVDDILANHRRHRRRFGSPSGRRPRPAAFVRLSALALSQGLPCRPWSPGTRARPPACDTSPVRIERRDPNGARTFLAADAQRRPAPAPPQQATVGIDGDVALAADDLRVGVVTARTRCRRLDGLAVDDGRRRVLPADRHAHGRSSGPRHGWYVSTAAVQSGETTNTLSAKGRSRLGSIRQPLRCASCSGSR